LWLFFIRTLMPLDPSKSKVLYSLVASMDSSPNEHGPIVNQVRKFPR
jgi:hypothetical protein